MSDDRATIPEVEHRTVTAGGAEVHYVAAGDAGTPVLLVHGFPESWWAFRGVIPRLAGEHRVFAIDLPGFGDSANEPGDYGSAATAEVLRGVVEALDVGPVHLVGQDIGGVATFRLAAAHPELLRSYTAIESALPGYGLDGFADVAHGGVWYIGTFATEGVADVLLAGREREFLTQLILPGMLADPDRLDARDVDELVRVYSRPHGFRGAEGFYASMLHEGDEVRAIVAAGKLQVPVLALGAGTGDFTRQTMEQVAETVASARLDGVGHLAALEDPAGVADALRSFYASLD